MLKSNQTAIKNLCECAKKIPQEVEFLDVGGGLGVAYRPEEKNSIPDVNEYMSLVSKTINKYFKQIPEIVFEPGRIISAFKWNFCNICY